VASSFAKALGCRPGGGYYRSDKYVITNCIGHLYRLWEPDRYRAEWKKWSLEELPILVNEYNYEKNEATAKQAAIVENLVKAHAKDAILIATDAGREGEVIAREVLREAGLTDISRCKRFWVSEALTPEVIRQGIASAKPLSAYNAVASRGFARQRADWLVGMNLSRFITLSSRSGEKFSVGRVQSAVLSAVLSRNDKVTNFVPAPYNELEITVKDKNGVSIKALLANPGSGNENASAFKVKSPYLEKAAAYAGAHTKGGDLSVTAETKKRSQKPEKLLNLTALQKTAFRLYGYSPDETLGTAQALYEKHKCLSYPRTPSRVMGDNNVGW
jgi:DNA topoisomerase-3